jgi:hypothetical protein
LDLRIHIVSIVSAVAVFAVVFELVRRRRLMERYALLWLLSATTLLVLSVWSGLLSLVADAVGIAYPPNALFLVALGVVLVLLLHFSLVISALTDQTKVLAQRLGMLQQQVDELGVARQVDAIAPAHELSPRPERADD